MKAAREKRPGLYGDGGGLYLQVSENGSKSWIFRYWVAQRDTVAGEFVRDPATHRVKGRNRDMGLGSYITLSLEEARDRALECRKLREKEIDPIEAREEAKRQAALERAKSLKFKDAATAYMSSHRIAWKNEKHAGQWSATLEKYAYPIIGDLPLQVIDTTLLMRVIEPIWSTKPETASRLRGRIESVLDWATVRGYRRGENPARWRGHLAKLLPARGKVRKVEHHAALPYAELPAFLAELRQQNGVAARALEFTILTAARTNETIGAKQDEIDRKSEAWVISGARMKAGKDHRVPLTARTLELVGTAQSADDEPAFIFPGGSEAAPLSNMAMLKVLERMGRSDLTVHGFRSTFRDWAAECTDFPNEVVEMSLAHTVASKTEAAYRRGDLFEKRRRLMNAWADFCGKESAPNKVIPLTSAWRRDPK